VAFGEDLGQLGGVNQAFAGLQAKYGELRVSDTGIRETTIIGQAIGLAMRGLRPIAEIQYLDYIFYAMATLTDDLATVRWRTKSGQSAPVIIRTRGHRLEGVWHSGSPMGSLLHTLRGVHICVPRDMTQAVGFYNTLLQGNDPGLIVEVLNGYRLKERLPQNLDEYTLPLGEPEILREGHDITLVTYGAMCPIVMEAAARLSDVDIEVEVIDVQTLLPFDLNGRIVESLKKTNKIIFADEDVPGGATAFMMQQVLDEQNGYRWLDAKPCTVTAKAHRPAYGKDGNYFSKPNVQDIFEVAYDIMTEYQPEHYPTINQ
jgi:pyruvate/2-oxoglutarate/acetoin dehydrogenase E1 component